jgi:hypothetical protein
MKDGDTQKINRFPVPVYSKDGVPSIHQPLIIHQNPHSFPCRHEEGDGVKKKNYIFVFHQIRVVARSSTKCTLHSSILSQSTNSKILEVF